MAIVNEIKKLVTQSRLFVSAAELEKSNKQKKQSRSKGKYAKQAVKIGQGGTLDPLADGVLGN
jgi:tRNA pseudouridine55 synthase